MLIEKTNQLIEEVNELKDSCMSMIVTESLSYMTGTEFEMFRKMFNLLNTSMDVMSEQAKMIDQIDKKLDTLLKRKES